MVTHLLSLLMISCKGYDDPFQSVALVLCLIDCCIICVYPQRPEMEAICLDIEMFRRQPYIYIYI